MAALAEIHPSQAGDVIEFLEKISGGVGPLNAALAVGWSPDQLRKLSHNPEFRQLCEEAQERSIETVEEQAHRLARRGNMSAIQLILYSQAAHRGWRPPTQRVAVNNQTTVKVENVEGVKAAVLEAIREGNIRQLQPGGALDVASVEISG